MTSPRRIEEVLDPKEGEERAQPGPSELPNDEPVTAPEPETLPPDPDLNGWAVDGE